MTSVKHRKAIYVNCWKCGLRFDIVSAKRCFEHLNINHQGHVISECVGFRWTTKCSHCGACICHKYDKMQEIECEVLNRVGIGKVMPSVKRSLNRT